MMKKYFISDDGRVQGECVVDFPANPDDFSIVELNELSGNPLDYIYADGVVTYSPAPVPRVVPQKVTRFQGIAAIYQAGFLDEIEAYMALGTTDEMTKLAWKNAPSFERASPFVSALAPLLGLTDEQIDDMFIFANTIG